MATLLKNVSNAVLHAFNALHQEKPGFVNKTKLKVGQIHIFSPRIENNCNQSTLRWPYRNFKQYSASFMSLYTSSECEREK